MFHFKLFKINRIIKKLKPLQAYRVNNQPKDEQIKKEIFYYNALAALYKKLQRNPKFPYAHIMYIESYKAAAQLDDADAHFQLAQIFIDEAKFRQDLQKEGLFNSSGNLIRMNQLNEEAHAHLLAGEQLGSVLAKRLRGLCLINGWGVAVDKNAGFELVVASVEQEGSWDKVPQIFAEIGLNKPEFFAAIMQRKKNVS